MHKKRIQRKEQRKQIQNYKIMNQWIAKPDYYNSHHQIIINSSVGNNSNRFLVKKIRCFHKRFWIRHDGQKHYSVNATKTVQQPRE